MRPIAGRRRPWCSTIAQPRSSQSLAISTSAGTKTPKTAKTGGVIGAVVGSAIAVTTLVATGGLAILVIGPLCAGTGAAVGTFIGAMTSRGVEHQAANYYDQALRRGQLLVAA